MNTMVWGINFAPEVTGIGPFNTGLCEYLQERGHQVVMITGFAYYPHWRRLPGDTGIFRREVWEKVLVHRCWHYVPGRVSTIGRILHEISFVLTSFVRVLTVPRPDVYVIVMPSLLLGVAGRIAAGLKGRPYVVHVQDLQPDAAVALGMIRNRWLVRMLYRIETLTYRGASFVSGISQGMLTAFAQKGVPSHRIVYFPNWLRQFGRNSAFSQSNVISRDQVAAFRRRHSLPLGAFILCYSGNLGRKQGLELLIDAAEQLAVSGRSPEEITFLVVGEGAMRDELVRDVARRKLRNVCFLSLLPEKEYQLMLRAVDLHVILQISKTGRYFFPSKLLSILASGSAVLTVSDDESELARAVNEGGFGVNLAGVDARGLAQAVDQLRHREKEMQKYRERSAWVRAFEAPRVLNDYERALMIVVEGGSLSATEKGVA